LWQIFKSISIPNFAFSEVPKYFSYFYSLLLTYSIGKEFKIEKIIVGRFLCGQPSSAPTPAYSCTQIQPVTMRAPQSLMAGTRLSAPVSPIPSSALTDPHHRCDFGQTTT
jgi:hypothetical protein